MTLRKYVAIVDPRKRILESDFDVVSRHQSYAEALCRLSHNKIDGLLILQPSVSLKEKTYNYSNELTFLDVPFWKLLFLGRFLSSHQQSITLLVAGDPWISFFAAEIFNIAISAPKQRLKIQLQIHSELDSVWAGKNFRKNIQLWLASFSFKRADSIRATSQAHAKQLVTSFGRPKSKIYCIPVPLNTNLHRVDKLEKVPTPLSIGFVGRIQKERGLDEFIHIVKCLSHDWTNCRVVIAGDGPQRDRFLADLSSVIPHTSIDYLGQLQKDDLWKAWQKMSILVSSASSESYGRAIREALTAEVPVLAVDSLGARALREEYEKGIQIINLKSTSKEINKATQELMNLGSLSDYATLSRKREKEIPNKLANSWLEMIDTLE